MIDLPVATSSSPAAVRPGPNSPLRESGAQAEDSAFQAALALELGQPATVRAAPAPAAGAGKAKSLLALGGDTAQTAAAGDAPPVLASAGALPFLPALPGAFPFPPALASPPALGGTSAEPPAACGASALSHALAPGGADRAGLAADARKGPLARTAPAPGTEQTPFVATTAADMAASALQLTPVSGRPERGGLAPDARKGPLADARAAATAEQTLATAASAADVAASGQFARSAEGEIRREASFVAGLLDQHKSISAPAAALHSGNAPTSAAAVTSAAVAVLDARVGERGWDQALGDKLVWMAGQKHQVAELHLNPPDLGPLKITLTLNHDQASAQFVSEHAAVRDALETAMPRLREMLADSGITLGNTSVSTDAFREQAQPQHEPRAHPAPTAAADPDAVARGERALRSVHGLVDTFA